MDNPYSAPNVVLSEPVSDDTTYEPKVFSIHGRIGRLRYWGYGFVYALIAWIFFCALSGMLFVGSEKVDIASLGWMMNIPETVNQIV